jgi:hypothetical protein
MCKLYFAGNKKSLKAFLSFMESYYKNGVTVKELLINA